MKFMPKLKKHYLDYITKYSNTDKLHIKWNWAAFFLGPLWLFYRSMFLYGFMYFITLFAIFAFNSFLYPTYEIDIIFIVNILLGMYGTALFCHKYKKEILKNNSLENKDDGEIIFDKLTEKTRPFSALLLYIISFIILISAIVYMLYKVSNEKNTINNYTTENLINERIQFSKSELTINDEETFYDLEFEEVKDKLKKIKIGKEKYAVLLNHKEQFMQMYLDREENGIKYYHVEYKLSPGKIIYITYKEKVPEDKMLNLFYKFYHNDISFTSDIEWSALNFKNSKILD